MTEPYYGECVCSHLCVFAGREWDYVVVSCVSSLPMSHIEEHADSSWIQRHLGNAANHGQMAVALTRARKGLIIIGK